MAYKRKYTRGATYETTPEFISDLIFTVRNRTDQYVFHSVRPMHVSWVMNWQIKTIDHHVRLGLFARAILNGRTDNG